MNLFIDTNIFLSFYHLSNDDLEEIHKLTVLLEKQDVVLWLPKQVQDEFYRNRENKISDAIKKLKEQKKKPQFPQICKDYEEYSAIKILQKDYDKKISSLIKKVHDDVNNRSLKADAKITELFEKSTVIETTGELINKAKLRIDIGNPPGKNGSLGDAVNWEGLLSSLPNNEDLYLIADDKDYYSVLDQNCLKDFLSDEWTCEKNAEIYVYRRLSLFFKEHYPDIKLASELEQDLAVNSLVSSSCFSDTHNAISKLSKYAEFNNLQINKLAQAAIMNTQVNWVLCDQDVFEFYSLFLKNYVEFIEEDLRKELNKEIKECNSEEDA